MCCILTRRSTAKAFISPGAASCLFSGFTHVRLFCSHVFDLLVNQDCATVREPEIWAKWMKQKLQRSRCARTVMLSINNVVLFNYGRNLFSKYFDVHICQLRDSSNSLATEFCGKMLPERRALIDVLAIRFILYVGTFFQTMFCRTRTRKRNGHVKLSIRLAPVSRN